MKRCLVLVGILLVVVLALSSLGLVGQRNEPDSFRQARSKVKVYSTNYGGGYLEWYPTLSVYSENDQLTVSYLLIFPGRGMQGDIEGFAQIYNPEGTWRNQSYKELIFEVARFGWCPETVTVNNQTFNFPRVTQDNLVSGGYLTFRVPKGG